MTAPVSRSEEVIPISILTQKSLPSLPTPIPVLAVASSTHLRAFIHNALVEEGFVYDDHSDNSGEDWTEEIASAFEGLGRAIQSGEWLAGFRRARQALQDEVEKGSGSATKEEKDPNAKQSIQESAIRPPTVAEEQRLSQVMTKAPPTALSEEDPNTGHTEQVLLQMGELLARTPGQVPEDSAKHLLLVVTPFAGGLSYTRQDVDMDYVSSSFGCSFSLGVFNLTAEGRVDGTLLYGLDNWKESYTSLSDGLQIVGGTFALNGVLSKPRYEALCRTLRMSLFMFMSILIEQQVLRDFHAPLKYPSPPPTPLPQTPLPVVTKTPEPMAPPTSTTPTPTLKASTRMRGASSNLWSYITKKRDNLFARAADSFPLSLPVPAPRGGSLDLRPSPSLSPFNPERPAELNPTGPRRRTTSLLGLLTPTIAVRPEPTPPVFDPPAEEIFTAALARLQANASLLSTTPGTAFAPPLLLARLAEDPQHRVTGDEATALRSLAGWVGADRLSRAKELSAVVPGFVRHQTFVALYSEHVPVPIDPPESRNGTLKSSPTPAPSDAGTATASTMISPTSGLSAHAAASGASEATAQSSSCMEEKNALLAQCTERRRVVNFRYYAPGDQRLGESVVQWCNEARELCRRPKCRFTKGEHELRWIHGGVRIALQKHFEDEPEYSLEAVMRAWIRCKICGKETEPQVASSGTHLLSLAKYLEMLVYSPLLVQLDTRVCEHVTPLSDETAPGMRYNVVRLFGHGGRHVSFSLSPVEDVFELELPRFQIHTGALSKPVKSADTEDENKRVLRGEIKAWWQAIGDHLDELEEHLDPNALNGKKALPRLPSIDDAYEILGERSTPKALIAGLPDTSEPDDCSTPLATPREPALDKRLPTDKTLPRDKALPANAPRLLLKLRYTFQQQEQDLYAELARTPATALNDVRRSFRSSAKGAARRLHAWQDKHITSPLGEKVAIRKLQAPDPAWWAPQCHAVPGGSVLVHEEDWGSIIAFMLSSMDYTRELAAIGIARPPPPAAPSAAPSVATSPLPSPAPISTLSYFTAPFRTSGSTLDPDADAVGWHEPEACSSVISRKQHPRDHLLSLRDVLLHKRSTDEPIEGSVLGRGAPPNASFPLSVFAKPAVEVSLQAADGEVADPVGNTTADRLLHELEGADTESSTSGILNNSISSASGFVETHIRRGKLASLVSSEDSRSDSAHESGSTTSEHTVAPAPQSEFVVVPAEPSDTSPATPSNNEAERSAVNTITSTLANAMRAVIGAGSTPHVSSRPAHHGLLATDPMVIDERPHLKYDFTVGKIRFSCTAYYAKQFDVLRRKCGIDDLFVKSMQKSTNWSAEGGRSKSNFWMTSDQRLIIKTLVNAWNVADLQVLLDHCPSYFKYMNQTTSKATALAKFVGFYTVEVRNLDSGTTLHKADLVVMENLFFDRHIERTFDLKGIQGRKVKAKEGAAAPKTLFDEEWREGQQRALTLVYSHSKAVLEESVRNDCDFLAENNIMDYSLLLGIDATNKQISCGLVDTIGSYTFAKTLEYKAKQGLNSGKQVTVVPPQEYRKRFVHAMNDYFLPCPDKWSKPGDGSDFSGDPWSLHSVL